MAEFGLTDQGFNAPRARDLLEDIRSDYEQRTGLTIDWDADVFLGAITAIMSDRVGDLAEMLQDVADARDPDNATGHQLDTIGAVVGVDRQQATFSRVDLTLSGDVGTIIEEGTEVEADDGQIWIIQDTVDIEPGGTVEVAAQPPEKGRITATAGTITTIINPVEGWDSVTNAQDATPGQDREEDSAYRVRLRQSLQITGAGALGAIRSNLLDVDGVDAAIVIDNDLDSEQTVEGITIDPHAFAAIVYPQLTTDQEENLARTIYERAPAGIKAVGDQSATVTGLDGFDKTIRWRYAAEVSVDVVVQVGPVSPGDVEDELKDEIQAYFDALDVGESARILAVLGIAADFDAIEEANVTFDGSSSDVVPNITEIATVNSITVSNV